jgi:ABC-type sugar transport system ATPase subunit
MKPLLEMRSITKTFPGVKALNEVNLMSRTVRFTPSLAKMVRANQRS